MFGIVDGINQNVSILLECSCLTDQYFLVGPNQNSDSCPSASYLEQRERTLHIVENELIKSIHVHWGPIAVHFKDNTTTSIRIDRCHCQTCRCRPQDENAGWSNDRFRRNEAARWRMRARTAIRFAADVAKLPIRLSHREEFGLSNESRHQQRHQTAIRSAPRGESENFKHRDGTSATSVICARPGTETETETWAHLNLPRRHTSRNVSLLRFERFSFTCCSFVFYKSGAFPRYK